MSCEMSLWLIVHFSKVQAVASVNGRSTRQDLMTRSKTKTTQIVITTTNLQKRFNKIDGREYTCDSLIFHSSKVEAVAAVNRLSSCPIAFAFQA